LLADVGDANPQVVSAAAEALVELLGARRAVVDIVAECRRRSNDDGITSLAFALKYLLEIIL
jgi:hypothetical protein